MLLRNAFAAALSCLIFLEVCSSYTTLLRNITVLMEPLTHMRPFNPTAISKDSISLRRDISTHLGVAKLRGGASKMED